MSTLSDDMLREILDWATDYQAKVIGLVLEHGRAGAAEVLGVTPHAVRNAIYKAHKRASRAGFGHLAAETAPPGYEYRGTSEYRKIDEVTGQEVVRGRWVKTVKSKDAEALQELRETFVEDTVFLRDLMPAAPPTEGPLDEDRLALYPLGDPHVGMLAWASETGESWDLQKTEDAHTRAIGQLVDRAPPTRRAVLANMGDFFHADDSTNKTARSGHNLDVDGRYGKIVRVGVRMLITMIKTLLVKHEEVEVLNLPGNHDDHSALWLSVALEQAFNNEPRVHVENTANPFKYIHFGECLLGFCHGHGARTKMGELGKIMAAQRPQLWGATKHRHFYTGHVHHQQVKDDLGVTIETLRILPPGDAWHHLAGYRAAGRDVRCHVWDKEFGLDDWHRVGIERLRHG